LNNSNLYYRHVDVCIVLVSDRSLCVLLLIVLVSFFNLQKDPDEFENFSGNEVYKEQEHKMKAALHRWMIIYRDCVPLPIPPGR